METQDIKTNVLTREKCHICDKVFDSQNLELHFLKYHSIEKSKESSIIKKETFVCQFCFKPFLNKGGLKGHEIHVHKTKDLRFKCELCDKSFCQPPIEICDWEQSSQI